MEAGCSKPSAGAVPGLPDDPLVEILSRLPAKSVCRFKCVSKPWRDLIAHPDNRKKLPQAMQGLFVETYVDKYGTAESLCISFSFLDLTLKRSVPMDIGACFPFLTEMTYIMDSCNGLILFGHFQEPPEPPSHYYIVCNPTTKQWSVVTDCAPCDGPLTYTYLAFAPALSSHFHLVQFQMPDMSEGIDALHVYSSETGTWSQNQIDERKEQGQLEGWHHQFRLDNLTVNHLYAFFNGFLHVIVISASDLQHILAVEVQGKATRLIAVPTMADGRHDHAYVCYLGQSQGHLHCVTKESTDKKNVKLSTWVLQDYDAQEWVLKNTVNSLDVFGETGGMPPFLVVDIHQDCNVIFILNQQINELIAYNMDHKQVSVIATFKDHKEPCDFARYVPYFLESPALANKHRESKV